MEKFNDSDIQNNTLLKSKTKEKCMICNDKTKYIDYISEARFCCKECMDKFYKQYDEWLAKLPNEEL